MEEVFNYIGENQVMLFLIIVSIILAIIIVCAFQFLSKKTKGTEKVEEKKTSLENETLLRSLEEKAKETSEIPKITEKQVPKMEELDFGNIASEVVEDPVMTIPLEETPKASKFSELDALLEQMRQDSLKDPKKQAETYEALQEENAIISYEELVRANESPEKIKIEEEEDIPVIMSVKELEAMSARSKKPEVVSFETVQVPSFEEKKEKFKKTEFISPVYGKIENKLEYPKIPSFQKEEKKESYYQEEFPSKIQVSSLSYDANSLSEESRKNEEFLQALKEFRENL